jgi:hypothetical protein
MKALSKIQTLTTVGFLAIVLTFGMFFISPAQQAHAQSQSSAQQMILSLLAQIQELQALLAQLEGGQVTTNSAISIGDTVQVSNTRLSVRASASGLRLGVAPEGATATVIGGPQQVDGYTWWKLDYQTGPDGWSAGDWLRVRSSSNTDTQSTVTTQKDTKDSSAAYSSAGAKGALKVSVVGADLEINVASDITKAAAQEMCSSNLNAWRIQYSMRFGDKAIQCDWQSGGDRWSKAVAVKDGKIVDVAPQDANTKVTSSGDTGSDNSGSYSGATSGNQNVRNIVLRAGEGETFEFGPQGYRKAGVTQSSVVCNSQYGITNKVKLIGGQPQFTVETTEDARLQTCTYGVYVKNTRNNDAVVYEETVRVTVVDADANANDVSEAESAADSYVPQDQETKYQVSINLGNGSDQSIYYATNMSKSEARTHCADNLDSWVERNSQYAGKIVKCLWDDGQGDTYSNSKRIPGTSSSDSTDTATTQTSAATPGPVCGFGAFPNDVSTGGIKKINSTTKNTGDSTIHRIVNGKTVEKYEYIGPGYWGIDYTLNEPTTFRRDLWRTDADGKTVTGSCSLTVRPS